MIEICKSDRVLAQTDWQMDEGVVYSTQAHMAQSTVTDTAVCAPALQAAFDWRSDVRTPKFRKS